MHIPFAYIASRNLYSMDLEKKLPACQNLFFMMFACLLHKISLVGRWIFLMCFYWMLHRAHSGIFDEFFYYWNWLGKTCQIKEVRFSLFMLHTALPWFDKFFLIVCEFKTIVKFVKSTTVKQQAKWQIIISKSTRSGIKTLHLFVVNHSFFFVCMPG